MKEFTCGQCDKKFMAFPSERTAKNIFCSPSCVVKFRTGKHTTGNTKICEICKKSFYIKPFAAKRRKTCGGECWRESMRRLTGEKARHWKGGRWAPNSQGYITNMIPREKGEGDRILEHRRVMENYLGRKLIGGQGPNSEIVHHIDGNKENNNIENLELMTQSQHSRMHALRRGLGTHIRQ